MDIKDWNSILNTPPPTPYLRHYSGDPDVSRKVSGNLVNMAERDVYVKLPEFWEHAAEAWFAHVEAHFACRQVRDGDARYHLVVTALGSSTSSRLVGFIAAPPLHGKYEAIKALLLKTFSLSAKERARQILDIQSLGDSRPSHLMEKMLNLLGGEDPQILFMEVFLRCLPPRVQTALANTPITDPRALAEEADRFFLAARQPDAETLAVTLSGPSTGRTAWRRPEAAMSDQRGDTGQCFYHARFGTKAKKCIAPCSYKPPGNGGAGAQ